MAAPDSFGRPASHAEPPPDKDKVLEEQTAKDAFVGVLSAYGVFGPLATAIEGRRRVRVHFLHSHCPAGNVEVTGYADRHLRNAADPRDPANRRISLLLPFVRPPESPGPPAANDPAFPVQRPSAYVPASDSSLSRVHASD
ncbi:MAG TPA: hypothetical protein VM076_05015 [Gemmatimonadaceae bacterium]|nr:hypothetical protein [Gemmatimonadaceae bacterium]